MHWLDTAILGLAGFGAVWGALVGLLRQLGRLLTVLFAVWSTIALNGFATSLVQRFLMRNAPVLVCQITAYVVVFLVVCIVMYMVTMSLHRSVERMGLRWLNRLLGAVFGAVQIVLIIGIVLFSLASFAGPRTLLRDTTVAQPLVEGLRGVSNMLPREYQQTIEKTQRKAQKTRL